STGSDRGSKKLREGGEHASASTPSEPATTSAGRSTTGTQSRQMSASESAFAEEPVQTTCQMDEPSHLVFETDTPIDFSNFIMNWHDVDTLTPELLAGPTYELMRGSCNSLTELEYHLEEVYKAMTDQLDWDNPEGQQYPHNRLQPLPLIPDNRGRRVIPFEHFINNDLEYLWGGASSQKYTTSMTNTKAADYGHIKWIENLVPRTMRIQEPLNYDKHALWGVSHWGRKLDINQGRGLQVSQDIDDSHVTLTPTHSDGQQESSLTSSFVTNLLNPIIDPASLPPIPPTPIPSDVLQTLPTFASVFRFEDRVKSLEVNFSEFMRTNQSTGAVSNIPGLVHQYMYQEMTKAVREAVQTQTDRLQDSIQRENDEFLRTIDDNMKKIIKDLVKSQVKAQVTRILPRIEENGDEENSEDVRKTVIRKDPSLDQTGGAEDQPIVQTSQHPEWFSQPRRPPTPDRDWNKTLPVAQENAQSWISALAKQTDDRSLFNELLDTPIDFSNFIMNRLGGGDSIRKYTTSITKTKAADYGHIKWIEDLVPREMWIQEPISYDKHALWGVSHWGQKRQQFYGFTINREFALDVYSKRRIIAVTELKIVEWQNYKHLDWISCVEDLQLGVKSYQKRLNLTKQDTYRSDLKRREVYTAYSNTRGFIYQNRDRKNRLMRIDELYKFSDGTLNDVRNALDDRLNWIRMQYLPTTIWRKGDKDRATAMIQAIDKMLKTRRIMKSLERAGGIYPGISTRLV
nr:hypothetical protein [Tanacetum cinerariifolium]